MIIKTADIDDLLAGRLSQDDGLALLNFLEPENINQETFELVLSTVRATVAVQAKELNSFAGSSIDCCGTGGSGISSFNASTLVAFILASAGLRVTKIGNKAVTGNFGSFDLLNSLGLSSNISLEQIKQIMALSGMVFVYAPMLYPGLGKISALRRQFAKRTIFNYIGPLLNPFLPEYRVLGVSNAAMQNAIAGVLVNDKQNKRSFVVRGCNGLDEVLCHGRTTILDVRGRTFNTIDFHAEESASCCMVLGDATKFNPIEMFWSIVKGQISDGCTYKLVVNNAAAGLHVAGKATSMLDGQELANELINSGKVMDKVEEVRQAYAQCS